MCIVLSRPRTLEVKPENIPIGFLDLGSELDLANECEKRFRACIADKAIRIRLCHRILKHLGQASVIVTGRYGELFAMLRGVLGCRQPPMILLDVEWRFKHTGWLHWPVSMLYHRLVARGTGKIGVFARKNQSDMRTGMASITTGSRGSPIVLASIRASSTSKTVVTCFRAALTTVTGRRCFRQWKACPLKYEWQ